jgi:hypothetical protein
LWSPKLCLHPMSRAPTRGAPYNRSICTVPLTAFAFRLDAARNVLRHILASAADLKFLRPRREFD